MGGWKLIATILSAVDIEKLNSFWRIRIIKIHNRAGNKGKVKELVDRELIAYRTRGSTNFNIDEVLTLLSIYKKTCGSIEHEKLEDFLNNNISSHSLKDDNWCWNRLKKYSSYAKFHNDQAFYETAIATVCGVDNHLQINNSEFVGSGWGRYTLDSYRKLEHESGKAVFEKVYKNDSKDLLKLKFFYEQAYSTISQYFKVPSVKLSEGEIGTVAYFNWLNGFEPIEKKKLLNCYSKFRKGALKIQPKLTNYDNMVWDYWSTPFHQNCMKKSKDWLSKHTTIKKNELLLEKLNTYFITSPVVERVFTHGDLHPNNIGKGGMLIDFDRCGMYPVGYELAYLTTRSLNFNSVVDLETKLSSEIEQFSKINQIGFYFFLFVYFQRSREYKTSDKFLLDLWKVLNAKVNKSSLDL